MRLLTSFLVIAVLSYAAFCALLYFKQRAMIYYPQPAFEGMGEVLRVNAPDSELLVSTRAHAGPKALLYFGGNAENVAYSVPELADIFPGHAIYALHYRGYGGSAGTPSERAIQDDALRLYDHVRREHGQVIVIGRSLGSGVAVRVAAERPVSQLVLVTPYDSVLGIAAKQFPYIPVQWLLVDKFESWRHVPRIAAPTLIIAAEHDEIVPRWSTERLHARFPAGGATLQFIPETDHNTVGQHPLYLSLLRGLAAAP
jgi:uncharacterized protein